jgi:hypothetical protein
MVVEFPSSLVALSIPFANRTLYDVVNGECTVLEGNPLGVHTNGPFSEIGTERESRSFH